MEPEEGEKMKFEYAVEHYPGDTGEFVKVIEDKCTACGNCAAVCALGVWSPDGSIYKPSGIKKCGECGACWNVCGADAIDFNEPSGGTGVRFTYG
jgi:MinD superfamily P-loop ATPase